MAFWIVKPHQTHLAISAWSRVSKFLPPIFLLPFRFRFALCVWSRNLASWRRLLGIGELQVARPVCQLLLQGGPRVEVADYRRHLRFVSRPGLLGHTVLEPRQEPSLLPAPPVRRTLFFRL